MLSARLLSAPSRPIVQSLRWGAQERMVVISSFVACVLSLVMNVQTPDRFMKRVPPRLALLRFAEYTVHVECTAVGALWCRVCPSSWQEAVRATGRPCDTALPWPPNQPVLVACRLEMETGMQADMHSVLV